MDIRYHQRQSDNFLEDFLDFHNLKVCAHEKEFENVSVIQICDDACFFFFREFFPSLAVTEDKLVAVHPHMVITEDIAVVGSQATEEGNQDIAVVDNQVIEEGIQGIIEEDIQAVVEGIQGTVIRGSQLMVDILAIEVGNLDIIGTRKAMALALAEVLPFGT